MNFVVAQMKWIMVVSGALTCTMIYAAAAPQAALRGTFGETLEGPLSQIVVRNWGVLIALIGAMLIYGAYRPSLRPLVLIVAGASKIAFIVLVLSQGPRFLGQPVIVSLVVDAMMVALFACYLVAAPRPTE